VQEHPRQDRTWEHWPGRRAPDDRIRGRLRALFTPTDDDAVEARITERGLEIEAHTARLQATLEGLERREEQAGRLRSAVEEMLRRGSAELDERQAELTVFAAELHAREQTLEARERELAARTQELGAVELRRAAVERREEAARQRETDLEAAATELRERAEAAREPAAPSAEAPPYESGSHLLHVADDRYRLVVGDGPAPREDTVLELEGRSYHVVRVGRSLLFPGDRRACAYLELAREPAAGVEA